MYADDRVIFFSAPLISQIELQLNLKLINLSEWLSTNKVILNLKKTEFLIFGTHQRLSPRHRWGSYNFGRTICETL